MRRPMPGDVVYTGFRSAWRATGTGTDQAAVSVRLVDAVAGTSDQTHQRHLTDKYLRMLAGIQHRF